MADEAQRIRTLLLRADNLLKGGDASRYARVREALTEAQALAQEPGVDERVQALIQHRLSALEALEGDDATLG